mmetsp:Transcript_50757/g.145672  ORF Transcript_50757/g.145672 Transcript_50757/m.145672 type:complete len:291 (+) Transcript_50757:236-1108(+)
MKPQPFKSLKLFTMPLYISVPAPWITLKFEACGPLGPCTTLKATASPSSTMTPSKAVRITKMSLLYNFMVAWQSMWPQPFSALRFFSVPKNVSLPLGVLCGAITMPPQPPTCLCGAKAKPPQPPYCGELAGPQAPRLKPPITCGLAMPQAPPPKPPPTTCGPPTKQPAPPIAAGCSSFTSKATGPRSPVFALKVSWAPGPTMAPPSSLFSTKMSLPWICSDAGLVIKPKPFCGFHVLISPKNVCCSGGVKIFTSAACTPFGPWEAEKLTWSPGEAQAPPKAPFSKNTSEP